MRILLMVIAYDPCAMYFLGMIKTEITVFKAQIICQASYKISQTSSSPLSHFPLSYITYTLGTSTIYQIHTHLSPNATQIDFQKKN